MAQGHTQTKKKGAAEVRDIFSTSERGVEEKETNWKSS
jgi:hypothetical protein